MRVIKKRKNKAIIILAIILLVLGAAGAAALVAKSRQASRQAAEEQTERPANTVDYGPPSQEEKEASDQQKDEIIKQYEQEQNQTPSEPAEQQNLTLTITRAAQTGPGESLNVRAIVDGTSKGRCEVSLSRSGQPTVNRTFQIAFEATSSSCSGANIDSNAFSESGEWMLSVKARDGNNVSNTVTQMVSIQK